MNDYFNLYGNGENSEEKLRELEKKGEEYLSQQECDRIEIEGEIPLHQPETKPQGEVINQSVFEEIAQSRAAKEQPSPAAPQQIQPEPSADEQQEVDDEPILPEMPVSPAAPKASAQITADEIRSNQFSAKDIKPEPEELEPELDDEPEEETERVEPMTRKEKKAKKKAIKKARRRKNRKRNIIWICVILLVSVAVAWFTIEVGRDLMGLSVNNKRTQHSFTIPEGASASDIIDTLEENDIIDFPLVFRLYSKLKHADGTFKFGTYSMYDTYNYDTIISMLQSEGAQRETVKVTIPECATVDQIEQLMVDNSICTKDQFEEVMNSDKFDQDFPFLVSIPDVVYKRMEGYLYPDTYEFFCANENYTLEDYGKSNAQAAIEKMLQGFQDHLPENYEEKVKALSKYGIRSLHDVLSLASIVDMECNGHYEQMKSVAAVFMNRLTWKNEPHFLGSTPTYYYPDNRYNTNAGPMTEVLKDGSKKSYKAGYEGLPPGAQCTVVKQAIEAVLNPDSKYLGKGYYFFVTDTDENYYYNQTLTQHNNTIAELEAKGKWDA